MIPTPVPCLLAGSRSLRAPRRRPRAALPGLSGAFRTAAHPGTLWSAYFGPLQDGVVV